MNPPRLDLNYVYNMDCLEGMKWMPDGSIDMIVADLPYGISGCSWDSQIDLPRFWRGVRRVLRKNGVVALTAQVPFTATLATSNREWLKFEFIFEKRIATNHLNSRHQPLRSHENVLIFYQGRPTFNPQYTVGKPFVIARRSTTNGAAYHGKGRTVTATVNHGTRHPKSVLHADMFPLDKDRWHPTQKPTSLFEYLIRTYTHEGAVVFDPVMGSGTTAVACWNAKRRFIGFEKDPAYWERILDRLWDLDETAMRTEWYDAPTALMSA
ncbi:MAG: site-specific DNA-methyltransferase [Bryobacterales bacterium]|nr:site-specific DNA-methyltransferase [Bryobacterales bacterium]